MTLISSSNCPSLLDTFRVMLCLTAAAIALCGRTTLAVVLACSRTTTRPRTTAVLKCTPTPNLLNKPSRCSKLTPLTPTVRLLPVLQTATLQHLRLSLLRRSSRRWSSRQCSSRRNRRTRMLHLFIPAVTNVDRTLSLRSSPFHSPKMPSRSHS